MATRAANPFLVQTALETQGGQQALGRISNLMTERREAQQAATATQELQEAFASNNPQRIAEVSLKYPQAQDALLNAVQFRSDTTRQNLIESSRQIAAGADPETVIRRRADMVAAQGGDPSDTLAELQQLQALGPEGYRQMVTNMYAAVDPKGYESLQSVGTQSPEQQKIQIEREKLDIRRLEQRERALDRDIKRETNELKRQELESRLENSRRESEQKKRDLGAQAQGAIATFDNALGTIDMIESSAGFEAAVGARVPFVDSLPGSDAQETIGLIETLQSQSFLNEIQRMRGLGALSEKEGAKLESAISSLNRNMSEKAFKHSLGRIREYFTDARARAVEQYGLPQEQPQQDQRSDADILSQYGIN